MQGIKVALIILCLLSITCPQVHKFGLFPPSFVPKFIVWLFSDLLVALVRSHFYVTESNNQHHFKISAKIISLFVDLTLYVFYYRKRIWAAISRPALSKILRDRYTPLTNKERENSTAPFSYPSSLGLLRLFWFFEVTSDWFQAALGPDLLSTCLVHNCLTNLSHQLIFRLKIC